LIVAFYASAEIGSFLSLGWTPPHNLLCLYAEHRNLTNTSQSGAPCGNSLLGALAIRGLGHMDADVKDTTRRLIMDQGSWSEADRRQILDYCQADTDALLPLLASMAPDLDLPRALLRGRYTAAVARMEWKRDPDRLGASRPFAGQLGGDQGTPRR
jgi:DNA polymerase-1